MRFVLFYHSFVSCWNHGNVHFLRGIARELINLGHEVTVYEPEDSWSRLNALAEGGDAALARAATLVPGVNLRQYDTLDLDLDQVLDGADVVLVHEWNAPDLVGRIGHYRAHASRPLLFFHDTHHRGVTAPNEIESFNLDGYDGILAFGEVLRQVYVRRGWGRQVHTWHEAADTALFRSLPDQIKDCDLIWIGNWGDEERSAELKKFLLEPVSRLPVRAKVHGVRYPDDARHELASHHIDYAGWLPNHRVPEAFARARLTLHIPRRPYVEALPGIPTIRVFEALACGIPLISAPWRDIENLFPAGDDYLMARSGAEMQRLLASVLADPDEAARMASHGRRTILRRHTCAHRVDELLAIVAHLNQDSSAVTETN